MGERIEAHCEFVRRCASGHAGSPEYLIGMRSGIFDATHLIDIWRTEIEASGRPSKAKAAQIALLQQVADSVWAMHDLLPAPPSKASPHV